MSSSDCLPVVTVGLRSMHESFSYLRALLDYASNYPGNESSIYGANLHLGSFPQKDLKISKKTRDFRAPDFITLIVQSSFGQKSAHGNIADMAPLIWEVKASSMTPAWFGERWHAHPEMGDWFMQHFHQIAAQVAYAKAKFNRKPIHIILSIDIWFILFYFPSNPPSLVWTKGAKGEPQLHPAEWRNFNSYIVVGPAPMINEDCTAFSPEFLYALQLSFENLTDVTITPHPSFRAPEGTKELITAQLEKHHFSAKFEEEGRRAEIDNKFALGEEDTDERSTGWSASEETETDPENQKHSATVPATLDHFLTSPAKTRSKVAAAKLRTPATPATQPASSKETANISGPSRTQRATVVNALSAGKTSLAVRRPRRKAANYTIGYREDVDE